MADTNNASHGRGNPHEILNVRKEITKHQSRPAAIAEGIGRTLAYPMFFIALLAVHILWVVLNLPVFPWFEPWDPYPFTFLATFASAEAPFISLLILIYQRRSSRVSELRDELDLQVSLHLERRMAAILRMLDEVQGKLEAESGEDPETMDRLRYELEPRELMLNVYRQLQEVEDTQETTSP